MADRGFITPEQIDHMAWRLWLAETGRWGSQEQLAAWQELPAESRREWEQRALAAVADYQAMTPSERRMRDRSTFAAQLRRNDDHAARTQGGSLAGDGAGHG